MATVDRISEQARPAGPPRLRDLVWYFLTLGTTGFGGPIATVGYMQRDLVQRKGWVSERDLLDGIALGQTMPGPLAAQVVMWVGFLSGRALGALIVAVAFVLPSFVAVLALAFLYVEYEGLGWVRAVFYGVAPGAIAIIVVAAYKLAMTTNGRERKLWVISVVVFVVTVATQSEIAYLFVASGLFVMLTEAPPSFLRWRPTHLLLAGGPGILTGAAGLGTQVALGLFFLKAGAFIFGSGLAIVPFLRSGVVEEYRWLTEAQFLDAVAIGLITPGPVVITATFVGYLVGGLAGAVIATVAIFTPIYLGVVIPGPWFLRHRDNPQVKAFVRGATAAAAGAIAGVTVILAGDAITDAGSMGIAVAALALILALRVKEPAVIAMAGAGGLLLY